MRTYFNSRESYLRQLEKNRQRNRKSRRLQRQKILRRLKPEIERISASSKLAEALAPQVK